MGFAQQCYPVGPVQICVFGDEGAGEGSPTSLMEKLCRLGLGILSVQSKDGAALCEWLRMVPCLSHDLLEKPSPNTDLQ